MRDAFYNWTGNRTPNLVLQLGDNAYNDGTDANFTSGMFNIYSDMLRKTPFWSCLGNHETNQQPPMLILIRISTFTTFRLPASAVAWPSSSTIGAG